MNHCIKIQQIFMIILLINQLNIILSKIIEAETFEAFDIDAIPKRHRKRITSNTLKSKSDILPSSPYIYKNITAYDLKYKVIDKSILLDIIDNFPSNTGKFVISFSLYGKALKYIRGAIRNAELCNIYFKGWICRFYISQEISLDVIEQLKKLNAEVFPFPILRDLGVVGPMFARFMVASDSTVDRYIIRDTDSRLTIRDRFIVQEWVNSKFPFHIIRDHTWHCTLHILGAMWGATHSILHDMDELIYKWTKISHQGTYAYGNDQLFLFNYIWPRILNNHLAHDSYCCKQVFDKNITRSSILPFPIKRSNYEHIGQVFDEFELPNQSHIDMLKNQKEC